MDRPRLAVTYPGRLAGKKTVSDRLVELGISRIKSTLSSVMVSYQPYALPSQYSGYLSNFSSWVRACYLQVPQRLGAYGIIARRDSDPKGLPMRLPELYLRLNTNAPEVLANMLTTRGFFVGVDADGKNSYIHRDPTVELVMSLLEHKKYFANTTTFRNAATFEGMVGLLRFKRLIELCISTHSFPLCADQASFDAIVAECSGSTLDEGKDASEGSSKKRERVDSDTYVNKRVKMGEGSSVAVIGENPPRVMPRGVAYWAKPFDLGKTHVEPSSVAAEMGTLNAFVLELIDPNMTPVMQLLNLLTPILAHDADASALAAEEITSTMAKALGTTLFSELIHIAHFFMVSMRAGLACIPLFRDRTYVGSLSWGYGAYVNYDNKVLSMMCQPELNNAIASCCVVNTNLDQISALTGVDVRSATSIRGVDTLLRATGWNGTRTQMANLVKLCSSSSLASVKYVHRDPESIRIALQDVQAGLFSSDHPMYPTAVLTLNIYEYHLSRFGSMVPSCHVTNAPTRNIRTMPIPPSDVTVGPNSSPFRLVFEMKALSVASDNWRALRETGLFTNGQPRRGLATLAIQVDHKDRDAFLMFMRELVIPEANVVMAAPAPPAEVTAGLVI